MKQHLVARKARIKVQKPWLALLLVSVFSLGLAACEQEQKVDTGAALDPYEQAMQGMLNTPLQTLELFTLAGEKKSFGRGNVRKPIVLNIWATWCPPCVKELPDLLKLAQDEHLEVVTIATDRQLKHVQSFLEENDLTALPVYVDPFGRETRSKLQAQALPQTYILSERGMIKGVETGERQWAHPAMRKKITQILAR